MRRSIRHQTSQEPWPAETWVVQDGLDILDDSQKKWRVRLAGIDAATVRQAARAFELHEGRCPSMDELLSSAALDDEARTVDPWDTPFRLECSDGPRVSSAGPDREFGTEDDIGSTHVSRAR